MDFDTKSKLSGDDDLDALEQDVDLKKQKKKRIKKDKGKRKWQPLAIDVFVREHEESVRPATTVVPQRRRLQPQRTDRRDALVGTDTYAELPSERTRPYAPNTQRLRKPSSSDSGTDERCASIAAETGAAAAAAAAATATSQQQSSTTSSSTAPHKPSGSHQSSKGIQSLLDLEVAPTPQALSAVAGIRSSLEYEYRHCGAFPSSDPDAATQTTSKQSDIPPPPGLTSGISFEIPGALASEAPTASGGFKFTYESSADGDGNEEELDDDDEDEADAVAYTVYSNYGGYAHPLDASAAEQYLSAGNRHKLYGRFFDRRARNDGFQKKGRELREQQPHADEERMNDAAASQSNRFATRRHHARGRFAQAFAADSYNMDYSEPAYISPQDYIQGTLVGSADMCVGWAEAFLSDPQELVSQQEMVAPLSSEQLAALNQYVAQLAVPVPLVLRAADAPAAETEATALHTSDEGEQVQAQAQVEEQETPVPAVVAIASDGVPMTPEQMLYYCYSLWYFSSGDAGDQVAQFSAARAPAQQQAQDTVASGETTLADSGEQQQQQQEPMAAQESTRTSSPDARATPETCSSPSIGPQTAPTASTVSDPSAMNVDSALSLSSAPASDLASVGQTCATSPPEQSSSPAPTESLASSTATDSSASQSQQFAQSFGVFHNGTLYFGPEAARIAAKVLNQSAPVPPVHSLYYCDQLGSPLAFAAASAQMGNVFFNGAPAANVSAVDATSPYFDAYSDAEALSQLQRLNLHSARSSFGDSVSLPLLTA